MQTLNLLESQTYEYNAFKIFDLNNKENTQRKLALMEQLQCTLELDKILNIFAMEASKYIAFSGLYFTQGNVRTAIRGSKQGKAERLFELKINNEFLGTLTYAINSPISLASYKILEELHQYILHPLNNAIKYKNAMSLAMQDSLTGLANRRYFDEQLKRAMHHANRQKHQVGLVVADLNKFKAVNDTFGHHVGDEILKSFAKALELSVRDSDSVFRFGGDEFVIIVEEASQESLFMIEARIQKALDTDVLLTKYNVGCSLGYTFMNRADDEKSFFERADQALYQQKFSQPMSLSLV
ncbi:GGDEF domain-containing protein [Colwellia sp. RE-S-Sl-9]